MLSKSMCSCFCPQNIGQNHKYRLLINFQKCDKVHLACSDKVQLACSDSNNQNFIHDNFGPN